MMYHEIGAKILRRDLSQTLDKIQASHARILIKRNGRAVAALVPVAELMALEKADGSRMTYHEQIEKSKLREIRWLKDGLDGARYEENNGET